MAKIVLENIVKVYDKKVKAIDDVNLTINDKEFIVFVGPSGCGKSTLLRMIAGLEDITYGKLYIDDVLSNAILPKDRDIAMVFQSYALYPTMTVYENIAFGIKMRNLDKVEVDRRVREAAEMLGLTNYLERKPLTLSGGQRQRVALGRAIVRNAKVFLLDEPLSNLDAKLRGQMRTELTKLHDKIQKTMIYVTHDQVEAMTMADRIVIINKGKIQQVGTPKEIYEKPNNVFVATFIGQPAMNIIETNVSDNVLEVFSKKVSYENLKKYDNQKVLVGIRPCDIKITKQKADMTAYEITYVELLGAEQNIYLMVNNTTFIVQVDLSKEYQVGDKVSLSIDESKISYFDITSQERI